MSRIQLSQSEGEKEMCKGGRMRETQRASLQGHGMDVNRIVCYGLCISLHSIDSHELPNPDDDYSLMRLQSAMADGNLWVYEASASLKYDRAR
jgi:hypothetical protein